MGVKLRGYSEQTLKGKKEIPVIPPKVKVGKLGGQG